MNELFIYIYFTFFYIRFPINNLFILRLIEQCYLLRERYERVNHKMEVERMTAIAEKALEYRYELQKLLDLNFDKPTEELKEFAKKNNMDLKDNKVQKYFLDIRKKYLEDINKFYEKNFSKIFQNTNNLLNKTKKIVCVNKQKAENTNEVAFNNAGSKVSTSNNSKIIVPSIKINNDIKVDKKSPCIKREFIKNKTNYRNSLIDSLRRNISPPIFFTVSILALVLYFFKNHHENS